MISYALTGTPGTGKTSISEQLNKKIVHLSDLYSEASNGKTPSGEWLIDIEKLNQIVQTLIVEDLVVEGHLAHMLEDIEQVIVLRCDPNILKSRIEERHYSQSKIRENMEAEAMGIIYSEAAEIVDKNNLFQLDTTECTVHQAVKKLNDFFDGKVKLDETIDYSEKIMGWY